ncbi:hypothetical protein F5Y13DRAFT_170235 [Hypoxylon sp. FL1857]|nr:hypothetical protein F5Y13DRAFT_170235 [Hypoxylon sp. FL1857]
MISRGCKLIFYLQKYLQRYIALHCAIPSLVICSRLLLLPFYSNSLLLYCFLSIVGGQTLALSDVRSMAARATYTRKIES